MKNKEDLVFSSELVKVFKKLYEQSLSLGWIGSDQLITEILRIYSEGLGTDEQLLDFFKPYQPEDIKGAYKIAQRVVDQNTKKLKKVGHTVPVYNESGLIPGDSGLNEILAELAVYITPEIGAYQVLNTLFLPWHSERGDVQQELLEKSAIDWSELGIINGDITKGILSDDAKKGGTDAEDFVGSKAISDLMKLFKGSTDKEESGGRVFSDEILKEKIITPQTPPNKIFKGDLEKFEKAGMHEEVNISEPDPSSTTPFLDQYSIDMTRADKAGKYDPILGRERELDQLIKILCCRLKNNAVLLGEAGVGKTAVVECLVQRINKGNVPDKLKNKRICSLDLNALVSGTKYRGEYEARLQGIIKEVVGNPDIIVYIDELHNLIGNGSTSGQGDGANILKPYLARGEFQCIGSTTFGEYRKFVEKDAALKRRFQNIQIDEPDQKETVRILSEISKKYEDFHRVRISQDILRACVEWSGRYIVDRFFPDKAIDVLDRSSATASLRSSTKEKNNDCLELETIIEDLKDKKLKAVLSQDFELAGTLRDEQRTKEADLENLRETKRKFAAKRSNWEEVTIDDVASEISKISKVPLDKIRSTDRTKIKDMKKVLESKVIGQAEAVNKILISLQRNIMGFRDENKPIASYLLCGETGTGKSYISKIVAKEFFGSEKSLVRIDCGEFTEGKAGVSKLTGATPGYVGYDDESILDQVRKKPFSVLLVDEVDKAAPEVFNIFMNILDEGYCILGNGEKVDFRNTIIIFTGNIGTKELQRNGNGLGFGRAKSPEEKHEETEATVKKAVGKFFRPEFLNRLTGTVVFNSLTKGDLEKIFTLEFAKVKARISRQGYKVNITKALKDKCISDCDVKFGARDLHRSIAKNIEDQLCEIILESEEELKNLTLDWNGEKVVLK